MDSRRFEFVGGGSAKFWEVSVTARQLGVRFGRIGTDGQTKLKPFADEQAALAEAEKLIREKVGMPVGVGFGIRDGATAARIATVADAVVIGSRIIEEIEGGDAQGAVRRVTTFLSGVRAAMDGEKP